MAPRAFGALFALVAAMLLLASLGAGVAPKVIPGWWDGHPGVDGKTIERKEIHVGLLGGHGCNLGETVKCEPLPTGALLEPIGIGEMAVIGATLATLIALMLSAWAIGDRRKSLARIVLGETMLIGLIGAALLVLGPQIKSTQHVDVPIGLGMMMFWAGVGCASIAAVITMRLEREPLRLRASVPPKPKPKPKPEPKPEPEPEPVPAFDFNELVREDQLRAPVPSPGGQLAGPAGPLMPMGVAPPPLSPLEMLPPIAAPSAPPRASTFERQIYEAPPEPPSGAAAGPEPVPAGDNTAAPSTAPLSGAAPADSPVVAPPRPSSPSVPPPAGTMRTKAASLPPPVAAPMPHPSKVPLPGMPPILPAESRASTEVDATPGDSMEPSAARDSAETMARARVSSPAITPDPAPRDSAETLARPRVSSPTINPPLAPIDPARPRVPAPAPRDSAATLERSRVSSPTIDPPLPSAEPDAEPATRASQVPISTAPASLPPPRKTTQAVEGPTPGCPQCEAPMAWVDEHLRFYCPQCRMYF